MRARGRESLCKYWCPSLLALVTAVGSENGLQNGLKSRQANRPRFSPVSTPRTGSVCAPGTFLVVPTSPCDQQRDKERENVAMSEVLVVNQMTWPELARQCIVANVRSCGGGVTLHVLPVRGEGWLGCGTTRLILFSSPAEQQVACYALVQ